MRTVPTRAGGALIALGVLLSASVALGHGDVQPQPVDTTGLEPLGTEWKDANPYSGNAKAIEIGTSGYAQNCARCHGLQVISGGLAPDLRYLEKVRAAGITIPIIPGILPVQNFKQAANFARRTGASVPYWLAARFEGLDNDVDTRRLIAAAVAAEQVLDLVDQGVNDFHFYSMNRSDLVYAICHLLGLRSQAPAKPAVKPEAKAA